MDEVNLKTEIPFKAGVIPGKLIACEVHNAQGLVRRIDFDQSNMMSMRVIHRLATVLADPSRAWSFGLHDQFGYSRLGTGLAPNPSDPANLLSLAGPILSWTDTQYLASNADYNSTTSVVDLENDDIRYRWRISHQHAYATSDVTITEIGYTDSPSPASIQGATINSRVVLPTPISLEVEQYLVTIYEFSLKLPSIVPVPVASMNIQGVPVTSGRVAFRAGHSSTDGETTRVGIGTGSTIVNAIGMLRGSVLFSGLGDTYEDSSMGGGVIYSTQASFLPVGQGRHGHSNSASDFSVGITTIATYNNDGIVTRTFSAPRDVGATVLGVHSIFITGFQFLLEEPFDRYSDQAVSITASIKWELLQGVD